MKRIVIGRGLDSDIVINDGRDGVSRHHAVITFNLLGKMKLSDTSSNGTFINDNKMLKGTSINVTRNDKIRLADYWVLDWAMIKDPYRRYRQFLMGVCAVVLVGLLGWGGWSLAEKILNEDKPITYRRELPQTPKGDDAAWNADSTMKVAPTIEPAKTKKTISVEKSQPNKSPKKQRRKYLQKRKEASNDPFSDSDIRNVDKTHDINIID